MGVRTVEVRTSKVLVKRDKNGKVASVQPKIVKVEVPDGFSVKTSTGFLVVSKDTSPNEILEGRRVPGPKKRPIVTHKGKKATFNGYRCCGRPGCMSRMRNPGQICAACEKKDRNRAETLKDKKTKAYEGKRFEDAAAHAVAKERLENEVHYEECVSCGAKLPNRYTQKRCPVCLSATLYQDIPEDLENVNFLVLKEWFDFFFVEVLRKIKKVK